MADQEEARRAGRAFAAYRRRRRAVGWSPYEDEWPALRREILANGGIGPSPDWDREDIPGDLYRERGRPPDMVAAETFLERSDRPPWQQGDVEGDDDAMMRYLQRAYDRHRKLEEEEKRAEREEEPDTRPKRSHEGRRTLEERERRHHEERMSAWVREVRARRLAEPRQPAIGFYTDDEGEVHPVTAARVAGRRYARRRGR